MQDRPIQAEDGRIIFASTHVPNKQPRHGWTAIYSFKDGVPWSSQLACICIWCREEHAQDLAYSCFQGGNLQRINDFGL